MVSFPLTQHLAASWIAWNSTAPVIYGLREYWVHTAARRAVKSGFSRLEGSRTRVCQMTRSVHSLAYLSSASPPSIIFSEYVTNVFL